MIKAGYVWANALDGVTDADARMLDQINLAFGLVKDGVLSFRVRDEKAFTDAMTRIRGGNPDMKITLSVGGWGAGGFSAMAMTDAGRRAFAASCLETVNRYGLDGIDVDWEYPTIDWAGIDADPADRENFTHLLRALRDVLPDKLVTIAVGCSETIAAALDLPAIEPILDYVSLMTYDLRGIGSPAGPHTGLYPRTGSEGKDDGCGDLSVKLYEKGGIPRHKQILGAAFYSRKWEGVPAGDMHGLGQKGTTKESGGFGPSYGKLAAEYIGKNGYVLCRDNGAPYLYKEETGEFISFDDPVSVAEKVRYVKDNGLAGIMYWEHSCDPTHTLLTAIAEAAED